MLFALEIPTPFLPITSLQLQYFQAVTHSFVRRRSTIPPVFNNFRTLCVATGGGTPLCQSFGAITAAGSCSPLFSGFTRFGLERFSHNRSFRSFRAGHQAIPPSFSGEKQLRMQILRRLPSPFNAVYRHSMHGNTVRRKVWSHTANSGRLDAETFGGSALLFHCWLHLRPAGRHNLTSSN